MAAELAPWAVEALTRAGESATAHAMVQDFARGLDRGDAPAARAALTWSCAVLAETGAPAREGRDGLLRAAELYREAAAAYARLPRPYAQALAAEGSARCVLAAHTEAGPGPVAEGADISAPAGTASSRASVLSAITGASRTSVLSAVTELESCAQRFTGLGAVWDAAWTRTLLRTRQPAKKGRPPGRPSHADELSPP